MAVGDPIGADLTSGTTDGDTLNLTPAAQREITMDVPVELTSGVKYAIIVKATDASGANDVRWWKKGSDNYAGGIHLFSTDSGGVWSQLSNQDMWFITKATGVEKDSHQDNDSAATAIKDTWRAGQSFTASSTYTITSIVLLLTRTGTPGTVTVSIRATDDGLPSKATTPVPANAAVNIRRNLLTTGWSAGADTDDYDVYFGLQGAPILQESAYVPTSWTIGGALLYNTVYEWRIDSNNTDGTTTGDTWLFTILVYSPPLPTSITLTGNSGGSSGEGTRTGTATGENSMLTIRRLIAIAENRFWFEDI